MKYIFDFALSAVETTCVALGLVILSMTLAGAVEAEGRPSVIDAVLLGMLMVILGYVMMVNRKVNDLKGGGK